MYSTGTFNTVQYVHNPLANVCVSYINSRASETVEKPRTVVVYVYIQYSTEDNTEQYMNMKMNTCSRGEYRRERERENGGGLKYVNGVQNQRVWVRALERPSEVPHTHTHAFDLTRPQVSITRANSLYCTVSTRLPLSNSGVYAICIFSVRTFPFPVFPLSRVRIRDTETRISSQEWFIRLDACESAEPVSISLIYYCVQSFTLYIYTQSTVFKLYTYTPTATNKVWLNWINIQ